jgi:hypothetical protein
MLLARKLLDVVTILPDHNVCKHLLFMPQKGTKSTK